MASYFGQATSIIFKTLPFIILRALIYLACGVAFCLYWVLVYYIGQGAAVLHPYARVFVWIVAIILPFPIIRLVREYFLYMIKAAHVAVITQLAMFGSLPEGVGQIEWGKAQVMQRFKETSVLFVVDRLVNGVISAVNSMMQGIGNVFGGIPGLQSLVHLGKLVLRFSLTYVDEAILARNFLRPQESVWESAQSGLVLYAQTWKQILKTAFVLGLVAMLSYTVLVILLMVPFLGFGQVYPGLRIVFVMMAFIFAAVIKMAFLDPWALTNMILVYLNETKNLTPDKGWEEKLEAISNKFRKIKQNALAEVPPSKITNLSPATT